MFLQSNNRAVSVKQRLQSLANTGIGWFLLVALAIFVSSLPLFSQVNAGRILGAVTDQTGGVIVGATVTITDVARGTSRTLTTDQAGQYDAPNLTPGTYRVRAESKGFQALQRENVQLEVGSEVRVDLTLQPGEQTQTVTVTEAIPMVETTNATLGGTLQNQVINDLPLNGRNFTNLLNLRPGVTVYPGGGARTQSANGLRSEDQVYLIDGMNDIEPYTGYNIVNQTSLAGDAGTMVSIDAIQEFNTEENPKAEFGWKPGAAVNVGIKSGTNSVHGTAYAYGRDDSFDARNFFNATPSPKTPVALEQFGATVGGPIKKDKLFYFLGYEDQRYSVGSSYTIQAPITAATGGTAATSLIAACQSVAPGSLSANSLRLAGLSSTCTPLSNYPGLFPVNNGASTTYINNQTSGNQSDNGLAKIDYHINENNSLSGTYFFGNANGLFNDSPNEVQPQWLSIGTMRVQVLSGNWTWTPSSAWVNEVRVGYDRFQRSFLSNDDTMNPQNYIVNGNNYSLNTGVTNPLLFGFPIVRFNSFNSALFRLGGNWPKVVGPNGVFQAVDHLSYLHGNHAFKFGAEVLADTDTSTITSNAKGQIRFASLGSFFQGTTAKNSQILIGDPTRHVSSQGYAAFAQDDWRVTPRLTLNLGVRWEMTTVLKEANNLFGNFLPGQGLVQVGDQISSPYNGDHNDWAPRVGFAWDIFGNAKTVVRGGGGIYYEQLSEYQSFLGVANLYGLGTVPTGATINATGGTSGGNIVFAPVIYTSPLNWNGSSVGGSSIFPSGANLNCFATPCSIFAVERNLRTPYVEGWNIGVERAITNNSTLDVSYVGNHGVKMMGLTDMNQEPMGGGPRPFATQYPYLSYIDYLSNLDESKYNAMQATFTQRVVHGLSYVAGYTYSHALDDASENFGTGTGVPIDSSRPWLLYGNSDFDIRNRFTLSATYVLPGKKTKSQMIEGWQVNSIVTLQSGQPWYPQELVTDFANNGEVGNPATLGGVWDFFGNPSDFSSNEYSIPFCTGPGGGGQAAGGCTDGMGNTIPAATAAGLWSRCLAVAPSVANLTGAGGGCYVKGGSELVPPATGTLGNMSRGEFRDSGFRNWDFSVVKSFLFKERLTAQFRAEFFNILNHPNFANPYGGPNGYANNQPGVYGMGCGCVTPDQAAQNPVLGTGGARDVQLGLKLLF